MLPFYNRPLKAAATAASLLLLLTACGGGGGGSDPAPAAAARGALALVAPDPASAEEQPYTTLVETEYEIGRITVTDPKRDASYETDVHGLFSYASDAPGPMRVILLLHGRHQTCESSVGGIPFLIADDDQCPDTPVVGPADSFRGYSYLVEALAKAGYFVLSIDANDINDNDGSASAGDAGANARATLIKQHLDDFRSINLTGATVDGAHSFPELQGLLDFDHVGIMGHSRGGDGIARFVRFNRLQDEPHNLVAAFGLAPTDYNREFPDGVTFATLLPYCDGDVEDLQDAYQYDDARYIDPSDPYPKFQILSMGGNHNYFNRIWLSDDWEIWDSSGSDPHCGTNSGTDQRDNRTVQEGYGLFFMASFFRAFVGEEERYLSYWNGQAGVSPSSCPDGVGPCDERHHLSIHAGVNDRLVIEDFTEADLPTSNELGGSISFNDFDAAEPCDPPEYAGTTDTPCASDPTFSTTEQVYVAWTQPASISNSIPATNMAAYDILSLRVGLVLGDANNGAGQDFSLQLTDSSGANQSLVVGDYSKVLFLPPGRAHDSAGSAKTVLNAVDIPVLLFDQIDMTAIEQVDIVFDQTAAGSVQLSDLMLQRVQP